MLEPQDSSKMNGGRVKICKSAVVLQYDELICSKQGTSFGIESGRKRLRLGERGGSRMESSRLSFIVVLARDFKISK